MSEFWNNFKNQIGNLFKLWDNFQKSIEQIPKLVEQVHKLNEDVQEILFIVKEEASVREEEHKKTREIQASVIEEQNKTIEIQASVIEEEREEHKKKLKEKADTIQEILSEYSLNSDNVERENDPHKQLISEFRQLKEQDFEIIVNDIFSDSSDNSYLDLTEKRKKKAEIQKRLSKEMFNPDVTDSVKDIKELMIVIVESLKSIVSSEISTKLTSNIEFLVKQGLNLVNKINSATPKGSLNFYQKGTKSSELERYDTPKGSEDEGEISFTIYPAYIVNNKIREGAVVFIESPSSTLTSDNLLTPDSATSPE